MRRDGHRLATCRPPNPRTFVELPTIRQLLDAGCPVVAAGGDGVPISDGSDGPQGVEGVVDKDLTASLDAE
jgi:carbamate kinase